VTLLLAVPLVVGCAVPRIVPVPAPGVEVDAGQATATALAGGVELAVRPSAWRGSPWDLDDYVAPFLVSLTNGTEHPLHYDYVGFRLFDDGRFQYTALPPVEVERILRWRAGEPVRLAATSSPPPVLRRQVAPGPYWDAWWGPGYEWYGWPWYGRPLIGDVYRRALVMGTLQPGARIEGFVYFPRLRPSARTLRLEFHHQVGDAPRVLVLPFEVDRGPSRSTGP
jgi:hypothetical protein